MAEPRSADSISASIVAALGDAAMRAAAASMARDIAAMPSPAQTADELIELIGR